MLFQRLFSAMLTVAFICIGLILLVHFVLFLIIAFYLQHASREHVHYHMALWAYHVLSYWATSDSDSNENCLFTWRKTGSNNSMRWT